MTSSKIAKPEAYFQKGNSFFENKKYGFALDWYLKIINHYDDISTFSRIQNELAIIKSILNYYEHEKPSQNHLVLITQSFKFLYDENPNKLIVYLLEVEFNNLIKNFQKSILILDNCVKRFEMTDDLILLYIITYNKIEKNSECLKYFELLDSNTSEEFKKKNRETIIEQKSILYIKTGKFNEIFQELYALDMLQNEKFLQYNLMIAKACFAMNNLSESVALSGWLLSNDFYNSDFWDFLCVVLQKRSDIVTQKKETIVRQCDEGKWSQPPIEELEREIQNYHELLSTALKWKKITHDQHSEEHFEMISNHDSQLIHFLKNSQLPDDVMDSVLITSIDVVEKFDCKYGSIGSSKYQLDWINWMEQAKIDHEEQRMVDEWNNGNPNEGEEDEFDDDEYLDEYLDGFATSDPITGEEFEDPALHANWNEDLYEND